MAQPSLKIDRARYVLTVDGQRRIIRDADASRVSEKPTSWRTHAPIG
jgi:hypothetical protein